MIIQPEFGALRIETFMQHCMCQVLEDLSSLLRLFQLFSDIKGVQYRARNNVHLVLNIFHSKCVRYKKSHTKLKNIHTTSFYRDTHSLVSIMHLSTPSEQTNKEEML